jgi:hypothetical protein
MYTTNSLPQKWRKPRKGTVSCRHLFKRVVASLSREPAALGKLAHFQPTWCSWEMKRDMDSPIASDLHINISSKEPVVLVYHRRQPAILANVWMERT